MEASSEGVDRGARFTVRLPRLEGEAQARAPGAGRPELPPLDIAVIEDNADNRNFVAEVLRMRGHRVVCAEDGVQGMEVILAGPVDVALVDIGLPGWDGYELARRVRAASAGGAVLLIALTGYGRDEDRMRALAAGFDDFLVKPFDVERFEASVVESARSALSRSPLWRRSRRGAA